MKKKFAPTHINMIGKWKLADEQLKLNPQPPTYKGTTMTANAAIQTPSPKNRPMENRSQRAAIKKYKEMKGTELKNPPKKIGRPPIIEYDQNIARMVCERIGNGETLTKVIQNMDVDLNTIFRWLAENEGFKERYATARKNSATLLVERTLDEIDVATDPQLAGLLKVKSEARRWAAARFDPVLYGDTKKLEISGEVRHAHALELTQEQRMRIAQEWLTGLESAKSPALIEGTAETTGPDKPKRIKKV